MKFNLFSKLHSSFNRLTLNAENDSLYDVPEVSEPVFWVVFALALLIAVILAPFRKLLA